MAIKVHKSLRPLVRYAEEHGWTVEITKKPHLKFTAPERPTIFGSYTPSDYRAIKNIESKLRKAETGFRTAFQGG